MAKKDGVRVTFKAILPEAHVRHVARMVLEGIRRHSDEAEEWLTDQRWFRDWVADTAAEMVDYWVLHHNWQGDPAGFWWDQIKDFPGAERIAGSLQRLPVAEYRTE